MTNQDHEYVNLSESHEINNWLKRNGLRQTQANQEKFPQLVNDAKKHYGKSSQQHLKWQELDNYYQQHKQNHRFEPL
ncbi:hypothetical protein PT286_01405 [Neisseriaceae bacterium ESL0693]|nr:hypothetical protein [Neisseriaceae bacterium ESL0693]